MHTNFHSKYVVIPNAFSVIMIACILNGLFAYALFPLHLELACESKTQ
jgi:hypothetical protein